MSILIYIKQLFQRKHPVFKRKDGSSLKILLIVMLLLQTLFSFTPIFKVDVVKAAYTDIYVNATSGVDGPGGGGIWNAYKTIDYAYESVGAVYNPIRLYIMEGTYDERVYDFADRFQSGNATHPTIISAYYNATTGEYDDVTWKYTGGGAGEEGGFQISQLHNFIIEHINFANHSNFMIFLNEVDNNYPIHNGTIRYCTGLNGSCSFIRVDGNDVEQIENITIHSNQIDDICNAWHINSQECISFSYSHYCNVYNNTISNCYKNCIDVKSNCSHIDIYYNTINTTHGKPNAPLTWSSGGGIYFDTHGSWNDHCLVFQNRVFGNYSSCHLGSEDADLATAGCNNHTIYNNIFVVNQSPQLTQFPLYIQENNDGGGADNYVINCTMVQNTLVGGYASFAMQPEGENVIDCNFTNNICYDATHENINIYDVGTGVILEVYNNLFTHASSDYWGNNPVNGSPDFINNESDFRLQSSSDAIDAGIDTGILSDFDGNTRPRNVYYDIGAYEYQQDLGVPIMVTLTETNVHQTYATMRGRMDDSYGIDTTVGFHYGLTDSYGSSVTVTTVDATVDFDCHEDCYTDYDNPDTNYPGTGGLLYARYSTTWDENSPGFINFSGLSNYSGQTLTSATIGLYITDKHSSSRITVEECNEGWNEDTVTYNNQPSEGDTWVNSQKLTTGSYNYWTVTTQVQHILSGADNWYGLKIYDDTYTGGFDKYSFIYQSRTAAHPPILTMVFDEPYTYQKQITGLSSGTRYHYRAWGTNANGTGYGDDEKVVTYPWSPKITITSQTNYSISLSITKYGNSNTSVIVRKTGSYPTTPTDGTVVYNGTGASVTDTGLDNSTKYYYRSWGYTNWDDVHLYSNDAPTSNNRKSAYTRPQPPQSVTTDVYSSGSIYAVNISWTIGNGANRTVIRKSSGTPPSNPQSGTAVYNGTGTFYNDTGLTQAWSYRIWSYNTTTGLFSESIEVNWSVVWIECYDENTSAAINGYSVFFTNQAGTETYEAHGCTNPHLVNVSDIPTGNNIALQVNATDYDTRIYYFDIEPYGVEYITCYLSKSNDTQVYALYVNDETGSPVENAKLTIKRNIGGTYKTIYILLTDGNGQCEAKLVPNILYKITIEKTGFVTEISDYIPSEEIYTKTFVLHFQDYPPEEKYVFWDYITFNGTMSLGGSIHIYYLDLSGLTNNTQIYLYEEYNGMTLMNISNSTNDNDFDYIVTGLNDSRGYWAWLYYNHSYEFDMNPPVIIFINPVNRSHSRLQTDFESIMTQALGNNPIGWGNSIAIILFFVFLASFSPFNAGFAILCAGTTAIITEFVFYFSNPFIAIICPIIITIGVMYILFTKRPEEKI